MNQAWEKAVFTNENAGRQVTESWLEAERLKNEGVKLNFHAEYARLTDRLSGLQRSGPQALFWNRGSSASSVCAWIPVKRFGRRGTDVPVRSGRGGGL